VSPLPPRTEFVPESNQLTLENITDYKGIIQELIDVIIDQLMADDLIGP